jgi:hypothetical protein
MSEETDRRENGGERAAAPATHPFDALPFPSPGDRIRADDFKALSRGLLLVRDAFALSGALFGQALGQAKQALAAQQFAVQRVMSVFGTELGGMEDPSLDNRKVIQVVPLDLGTRQVAVVVTEAVESRRFAPNLLGLTYGEASERLRAILGDVTLPGAPMSASEVEGLSLAEAKAALFQ